MRTMRMRRPRRGEVMRVAMVVAAMLALSACEPEPPKVAAAEKVTAQAQNRGAAWPLMLAHCLRSPNCDPASDFGQGAGQASNSIDQASWFAESKDVVKEGGQDYGASIRVSLYATRAAGGKAGRPLTIDETESSLRGANARRSTLSIEYRTPGGGAPEPHGLSFTSAQVKLPVPNIQVAKSRDALADMTGTYVESLKWPDGQTGAKVEITGKAGVLLSEYSSGLAAQDIVRSAEAMKRGFEPWVFYVPRNLRDEPLPALMSAIVDGETLGLKITAPDGVILADAIYTGGYAQALQEAMQALADAELPRPILDRCSRFATEKPEFWKIADVTAALRVCDPRTPLQRMQDSAPATPSKQ
jgi:hypothetical protein